jgi:hypothetical protein
MAKLLNLAPTLIGATKAEKGYSHFRRLNNTAWFTFGLKIHVFFNFSIVRRQYSEVNV